MNNNQTIAIGRYVDILNDLAFKTIFGCEANKDLLIALLNIILPDQGITDLQYLNKENSALAKDSKHSVFDVSCDTKDGRRIIVEVQREPQSFFEKRMIYYASLPILDQVRRGEDGNYDFDDIYMVCITKFSRKHTVKSEDGVTYRYALREESSGEIWSNALSEAKKINW